MKKNTTFTEIRKAGDPLVVLEGELLSITSSFSPGRIIVLTAMITLLLFFSWRIYQTTTIGLDWFIYPAMLLFFAVALWIDLDTVNIVNIDMKLREVTVRKRYPLRRLLLHPEQRFHVQDIQTVRTKKSMVRVPYNVWYLSVVLHDGKKMVLAVAREERGLERIAGVLNGSSAP